MNALKNKKAKKKQPQAFASTTHNTMTRLKPICLWLFALVATKSVDVTLTLELASLSSGDLLQEYKNVGLYAQMNLITATSVLAYTIATTGELNVRPTANASFDVEAFQWKLQSHFGLRSFPCLFCDSLGGNCSNITTRLTNMYAKESDFLANITSKAARGLWSGFAVFLKTDEEIDWALWSRFLQRLADALNPLRIPLHLWIHDQTFYEASLLEAPNVIVLSMHDAQDYNHLLNVTLTDMERVGNATRFGLAVFLPMYMTRHDSLQLVSWMRGAQISTLYLWSNQIDAFAFAFLHRFLT